MTPSTKHDLPYRSPFDVLVQEGLVRSNILLLPLFLMLVSTLAPYTYKALLETAHIFRNFRTMDHSEMMLGLLTLADITMIANLIVMIATGSYHIFVKPLVVDPAHKPTWLNHISSGLLKVKMSTSLVGISSIHLLRDFIDAHNVFGKATSLFEIGRELAVVGLHGAIHLVFLVSTVVLVKAADVRHSNTDANGH